MTPLEEIMKLHGENLALHEQLIRERNATEYVMRELERLKAHQFRAAADCLRRQGALLSRAETEVVQQMARDYVTMAEWLEAHAPKPAIEIEHGTPGSSDDPAEEHF